MQVIDGYKYKGYFLKINTVVGLLEVSNDKKESLGFFGNLSDTMSFIDGLVSTELEIVYREVPDETAPIVAKGRPTDQ